MRIKDISGKITKDSDVVFSSATSALDITVDTNNTVIFTVNEGNTNTSADLKYQLANPSITTHLVDHTNPHQTIAYFVEKYVENPATNDIIYETITPNNANFLFDLASIECYTFPTVPTDGFITIDILRDNTSIFNTTDTITSVGAENFTDFSKCVVYKLSSSNWYNNSTYVFYPGQYIKVKITSAYNVDKILFRMLFW